MIWAAYAGPTFHTGSTPAMAEPITLPTTPIASATSMETIPTRVAARALAPITRPRLGTRVKVVRPLRWLHSLVTARIAIMGRISVIGKPTAREKVS